jgi:hypothetical protein
MAEEEKKDPPIIGQDFVCGVKVVDFGDYRVQRGFSRRAHSGCAHNNVLYDEKERRIWCSDCERDVEPFDAFLSLIEPYSRAVEKLERRYERLKEAESFQIRSVAAKNIDEAWRKRDMVPSCPHCGHGLFPESFKNGCSLVGKEYARARIKLKNNT